MKNRNQLLWAGTLAFVALAGCGDDGAAGATGAAGKDGTNGQSGAEGAAGAPGATGAKGATGATGATGPAFSGAAQLATVSPSQLFTGRPATVTILGKDVAFTAASTVSFGAGVTVSNVRLISALALEATVEVAADAAIGPRTITVTTGSATASRADAITVAPGLSAAVASGLLVQGAEGTMRVRTAAPRFFTPTVSSGTMVVSNATFEGNGIAFGTTAKWIGSDTAELTYALSPFVGSEASLVAKYTGGATEGAKVAVAASPSATVTTAAPTSATLASGEAVKVFSFDAAAYEAFTFTVAPDSGVTLAPRIRAYVAGTSAPIAAANATTLRVPPRAGANTYKVVVSDSTAAVATASKAFSASVTTEPPLANVTTFTCSGGQCVAALTFSPTLALPDNNTTGVTRYFEITAPPACVIQSASASWAVTHEYPLDIRFDLTFPDGTQALGNVSTEGFRPTQTDTPTGTQTTGTASRTGAPWAGRTANGLWALKMYDGGSLDTGGVDSFTLTLTCAP